MTISTERRLLVYNYLDLPYEQRETPESEFRKKHNINSKVWRNLKADHILDKKEQERREKATIKAREQLGKPLPDYDSTAFLRSRVSDVDLALLTSCLNGNAAAQKVFRQILGQLIDKPDEGEIGELNADELFRIEEEAQRELREFRQERASDNGSQGNQEVPSGPALLSQNIREDS